jgi:hypothetical protein
VEAEVVAVLARDELGVLVGFSEARVERAPDDAATKNATTTATSPTRSPGAAHVHR